MPDKAMGYFVILGHRGAKGYSPENTIPSFKKAIELGADGIELDVHLSKDGELVVIHDDTVDRTTDGTGFVHDMTVQQLKRLDAGIKFGKGWEGLRIPLLGEVFEKIGRTRYRIELKHSGLVYKDIEKKVIKEVESKGFPEETEYSSFDFDSVENLKMIDSSLKTGIIIHGKVKWFIPIAKKLRCDSIFVISDLLDESDVSLAHKSSLKVGMWGVNNYSTSTKAARLGVDSITTDYPDLAVKARKEFNLSSEKPM
ncbi:MAG: glycerophosphodiester phosphodiesterase family protein [Conexivisphaerales archaeon]